MTSSVSPHPPSFQSQVSSTEAETAGTPHLPAQKLTALARFKSFAGGLGWKRAPENDIVFPPPSWFINDIATPNNEAELPVDPVPGEQAPEPTSFAQQLKALIDSLPPPAAPDGTPTTSDAVSVGPETPEPSAALQDGKGPPIPTGVDARLVRLLSSENVMNGDAGKLQESPENTTETKRQSVWAALDGIRHGGRAAGERPGQAETVDRGVMMYSPLDPSPDSQVELAESELEYVDLDELKEGNEGNVPDKGTQGNDTAPQAPKPPVLQEHWVPSTTKISLYTSWWGYRIYLPPPVMATLNSGHMKTTKRAAMITTALKWFLDKVPLMLLPPQVRGAVALLRRLTPLVGYIGIFVAWSWTRISACDKGNGVVLTATWLLPVALIPMSWNAGDIHGPPIRPRTPPVAQEGNGKGGSSASKDDKDDIKGKKKKK